MKNTLYCTLQNKLGALDRVLGALTHRGYMPEKMVSSVDPVTGRMNLVFTFDCPCEKTLEKLVKFLHKQIYVLEIRQLFLPEELNVSTTPGRLSESNVAPLFIPVYSSERRTSSHVRNR